MDDEGFFHSADGTRLAYQWYRTAGPALAGVVVVHGYGDHAGRYGELGRALAADGLAALAFDYRGHGLAGGQRGHCNRFDEYIQDLDAAWSLARGELGTRPMGLVAHSHGGLIALRLLCDPTRHLEGLAGLVISSPYLQLRMPVARLKVALAPLASRILPRLSLGAGINPADLTHDSELLSARAADPLAHDRATTRWYAEATAAQKYVAAHVSRLALPSLWLIPGDDPIADPAATQEIYDRAGGAKRLRVYEGFLHEPHAEVGRARVFEDVLAWLGPVLTDS